MKVLLINPPYPFEESPTPPFGIMSLAAYLLEQGVEVRVEDYIITPYSPERIARVLKEFRPCVVGAGGVTMNINKSLKIMKDYKEADPDLVTVMGGPHVTFDAENMLAQNSYVDFIVRGEGEITFTEIVKAVASKSAPDHIKGISYRKNGAVVHNEQRPFIEDINILPYPARHLVPISKYRALGFPINMITSRGCPHKCIFCVGSQMVGRKVRYYDVKRVVDEFELLSKMKFKQINIVDDLFTANKSRCIAICEEIKRRKINHPWTAFARVDTVSPDLLKEMKEAGCTMLCFGIESGNQEILDTIKKKTTLEKCRAAVAMCLEAGVEPMSSYILGLPGETPETVKISLEFAKNLNPNHGFHILAPFPGTEVREKSAEYGLKILTDDWDRYDANQAVTETPNISAAEINKIADGFNDVVKKYVGDIVRRKEKGEAVSQHEKDLVGNITDLLFARDVMMMELLERYPGMQNGADGRVILDDLASYIQKNTEYSREEIDRQMTRLLSRECIRIDSPEGARKYVWA